MNWWVVYGAGFGACLFIGAILAGAVVRTRDELAVSPAAVLLASLLWPISVPVAIGLRVGIAFRRLATGGSADARE